jgi:phosphatidylserine/phosphatidylglycerophosphate/cardiolipin synthase-like enzyme
MTDFMEFRLFTGSSNLNDRNLSLSDPSGDEENNIAQENAEIFLVSNFVLQDSDFCAGG